MTQEVSFDQLYDAVYEGTDPESRRPLCRVRFYNEIDTPSQQHLATTSASSDLTIFVSSPKATSSLRATFLPGVSLRVVYNQILFSQKRIEYLVSQLITIIESGVKSKELAVGMIPLSDSGSSNSPLPDPTSDLHWSLWRGAITDIFNDNAQKHPNKTCIVESRDDNSTITYDYNQINQASNLVAHYLLANNIQREDVVMIYAYRGVDLVIAIMGVLRAGATFSVIGKFENNTMYSLLTFYNRSCLSTSTTRNLPLSSQASWFDYSPRSRANCRISERLCYKRARYCM